MFSILIRANGKVKILSFFFLKRLPWLKVISIDSEGNALSKVESGNKNAKTNKEKPGFSKPG